MLLNLALTALLASTTLAAPVQQPTANPVRYPRSPRL
jgi:hypothetical protein